MSVTNKASRGRLKILDSCAGSCAMLECKVVAAFSFGWKWLFSPTINGPSLELDGFGVWQKKSVFGNCGRKEGFLRFYGIGTYFTRYTYYLCIVLHGSSYSLVSLGIRLWTRMYVFKLNGPGIQYYSTLHNFASLPWIR